MVRLCHVSGAHTGSGAEAGGGSTSLIRVEGYCPRGALIRSLRGHRGGGYAQSLRRVESDSLDCAAGLSGFDNNTCP